MAIMATIIPNIIQFSCPAQAPPQSSIAPTAKIAANIVVKLKKVFIVFCPLFFIVYMDNISQLNRESKHFFQKND
jgi:hypothetical protein